jgi:transcriptional regulator with XRE-family HTH domain
VNAKFRVVKALATMKGLTMKELARRIGVSRIALYKYLQGEFHSKRIEDALWRVLVSAHIPPTSPRRPRRKPTT